MERIRRPNVNLHCFKYLKLTVVTAKLTTAGAIYKWFWQVGEKKPSQNLVKGMGFWNKKCAHFMIYLQMLTSLWNNNEHDNLKQYLWMAPSFVLKPGNYFYRGFAGKTSQEIPKLFVMTFITLEFWPARSVILWLQTFSHSILRFLFAQMPLSF